MTNHPFFRSQGDVVYFKIPFPGKGKIVGCSHTAIPELGIGWIVELLTPIPSYAATSYPFTHIILFETWIVENPEE